ncbi:hypothetical protein [Streptomyces sp. NPDC006285]|uniref:hypothetical protein n=1 Tax=Streptomyces sp. NPDC006285 TaxID=3364742 RepID=UPI0036BF5913
MDDERQPPVQESRQRLVGAVAGAFEDARFETRQASRHEDLADDARGPAELAEWERIDQLLGPIEHPRASPGRCLAPRP